MTVTEEAAGPRLRGEPSSRATTAEVGILLYRGCQLAMVHGLTDMLTTASDFSVARGGRALRLSHWSPDEASTFGRSFDSVRARRALPTSSWPPADYLVQSRPRKLFPSPAG